MTERIAVIGLGYVGLPIALASPINRDHRPDLGPVLRASATGGAALRHGRVVVYESTVYPRVTEDLCGPALERASELQRGRDFKVGYSPKRINTGDHEHSFGRRCGAFLDVKTVVDTKQSRPDVQYWSL